MISRTESPGVRSYRRKDASEPIGKAMVLQPEPRMARTLLAVLIAIVLLSAGCSSQPTRSSVASAYPAPNYAGPTITGEKPTAPPLQVPAPKPAAVKTPTPTPQLAVPREWTPKTASRGWQWIVIHHSATPNGSAAVFDRQHRAKGWDELGYHVVIGNGTNSGDGQVEVGSRWPVQKWGAHAKTADNRYNEQGIGICLVGNFENTRPTARQMQSLAKLVAYLMQTYRIPASRVIGHRDTGKSTDCPGRYLNIAEVRRQASQMTATVSRQPAVGSARAELLGPGD